MVLVPGANPISDAVCVNPNCPLWGQGNGADLQARLEQRLRWRRRARQGVALMFCDVHRLDELRSRYGDETAERVLEILSRRIDQALRENDRTGRLGEIELVVLLDGIDGCVDAERVAQKIRGIASEPLSVDGEPLQLDLTIGVTLGQPGDAIEPLLEQAEVALAEARRTAPIHVIPINALARAGFDGRSEDTWESALLAAAETSADGWFWDGLPVVVFRRRQDPAWTMEFLSQNGGDLLEYPVPTLQDNAELAYADLIHPADRPRLERELAAALAVGDRYELEYRVQLPSHGVRWIWERGRRLPAEGEADVRLSGFLVDISERRQAEQARLRSETLFRQLFEASVDALLVLDAQEGRLIDLNAAALTMFGCADRHVLLGRWPDQASPPFQPDGRSSADAAATMLREARERGQHDLEWTYRRLDTGETFPADISLMRLQVEDGPAQVLLRVRDLSVQRRQEEQLRAMAYRDGLTGLPNRAAALEWMQRQIERDPTGRLVVLNLDLDRFQTVKDTFGTEISDRLLSATGRILRRHLPVTTLVARLDSDEFLVVQPWPAAADFADPETLVKGLAARLQQHLRDQLGDQMQLDLQQSFSCGAVIYPIDSGSPDALLQHANTALAKARPLGHGAQLLYRPEFSTAIERRIQLEIQLEDVLREQGLHLVYQPQVDRHGALVGAEALVRWRQADGTDVPPDAFVPLAESTGQIERLTSWLIETVCAQLRQWREAGKPLNQLALNVSGGHFNADGIGLEELLLLSLARHGIAPTSLELEVTETALLLDRKRARRQLQRLMRRGFSIALDDFGTGYSSLSILQFFPVKKLKIDKSFVQHITTSHRDRGLVESSLMIARRLGLQTLAEGVETEQQWHLLRDLGCDCYQGYLFDRGLEADAFAAAWLR